MIDYFITLIIHLSQSLEQCYRTIISEEIRGSDLKLKTFYSFDFRVEKPHPSTRFPSGTLGGRGAAFRYEDQVKYTKIPKNKQSWTNMDCSLARPVSHGAWSYKSNLGKQQGVLAFGRRTGVLSGQ